MLIQIVWLISFFMKYIQENNKDKREEIKEKKWQKINKKKYKKIDIYIKKHL